MRTDIDAAKVKIRSLLADDIMDLFEWRNHPETRKNSFTTNIITWASHEKWFKGNINNPNSVIYIACCGEQKIGSVRFDNHEYNTTVSVMLNPDFMRRRLSARVIKLGVDKFIKEKGVNGTVIAEIKKDNIASVKAFQGAGFIESYITYVFDPNAGS